MDKRRRTAINWAKSILCAMLTLVFALGMLSAPVSLAGEVEPPRETVVISKAAEWADARNGIAKVTLTIDALYERVEVIPKANIVLLFDTSGSMDQASAGSTRLGKAKEAATAFTHILLNEGKSQVKIAVVELNSCGRVVAGFSDNEAAVIAAINSLQAETTPLLPGGEQEWGTDIQEGIYVSRQLLSSYLGTDEYRNFIMLLTDGDPTISHKGQNAALIPTSDKYNVDTVKFPFVISNSIYTSRIWSGSYNLGAKSYTVDGHTVTNNAIGAVSEAYFAKQNGIYVYGVGYEIGLNAAAIDTVKSISSESRYFQTDASLIKNTLEDVARTILLDLMPGQNAVVDDPMGPLVTVHETAQYPITFTFQKAGEEPEEYGTLQVKDAATLIEWAVGLIDEGIYTLTYYVKTDISKITTSGRTEVVTNDTATLSYTDVYQEDQVLEYEDPVLDLYTYTVEYDANGGSVTPPASLPQKTRYFKDTEVTITGVAPVKANHKFLGWSTNPNATQPDPLYDGGDKFNIVQDMKFYAVYYTASGSLTLSASKQVNSQTPAAGQVFSFSLVSGTGTPAVSQSKNNVGGTVTFDSIVYALADAGQTYTYVVKETSTSGNGMTVDGSEYTVSVAIMDNDDGMLTATPTYKKGNQEVSGISFNNTYVATGSWSPSATKTVNGQTPTSAQVFNFSLTGNGQNQAKQNNGGTITFNTINYSYADVGQTYTYLVKETSTNGGGFTVDTSEYSVAVTIGDNGDGTLSVTPVIKKGGDTVQAISFANTYGTTGSLSLTAIKTVNGQTPTAAQVFDFSLTGNGQNQSKQNNGGSIAFDTINYTLSDVGQTYTYAVQETSTDGDGFTVDTAQYIVSAAISDNGDGTLDVDVAITKGGDPVQAIAFDNTYATEGNLALTATKTVNGQTPTMAQVFNFSLTGNGQNQSKTNSAGTIAFDTLSYALADAGQTYTYVVRETTADGNGFTVDTAEYTITVALTDLGDGTLDVDVAITKEGEPVQVIAFENTYEASGSVTLTATKTVNGQTPAADEVFEFTLTGNGADQTKQNVGSVVTFDTLSYTLDDAEETFVYVIQESSSDGDGFTVDTAEYTVSVAVTDNGDGSLTVTQSIEKDGEPVQAIAFDNTYEATGSLSLMATKTVNGKTPEANQVFDFCLENDPDTPVENQVKQNSGGDILFDTIEYTLEDAGNEYVYTIRETTGDANGFVTDKSVYTITVFITDNRDGTLAADFVVDKDGTVVDEISFENEYYADITITKITSGGDDTKEFAFTVQLFDGETELTEGFAYTGAGTGTLLSGDAVMLKHNEAITVQRIPVGTTYEITENAIIQYAVAVNGEDKTGIQGELSEDGAAINFVNTFKTTSFMVYKLWRGGSNGAISLTLYADGKALNPQPRYARSDDTYTYEGLPQYRDDGTSIVYSAKERAMDGYMTIYDNMPPHSSDTKSVYDGGTIINQAVTSVKVHKVWTGMEEGAQTPEVTMVLYRNDKEYKTTSKPDKYGWYYFYNLPLGYTYYVMEKPLEGYSTLYENSGTYADVVDKAYNGGKITNHLLPKTGDNQPVWLWIAIAAVATGAISMLIVQRLRTKKQ